MFDINGNGIGGNLDANIIPAHLYCS